MKKLLIILILGVLGFSLMFAIKDANFSQLQNRNEVYYQVNKQKPFTGTAKSYFENGQVEAKMQFKDGKKHGEAILFYENGQTKFRVIYKNGKIEEEPIWYDKNGKIKQESFILAEKGTIQMGTKEQGAPPALSAFRVTVDTFYIGKYEVTQSEFEAIMGFNPSHFKGSNLPVEQVTWYDAVMYCNILSKKEGIEEYYSISEIEKNGEGNITKANVSITGKKGFRLPHLIEWEFAGRGGNKHGIKLKTQEDIIRLHSALKGGKLNDLYFNYAGSDNIDKVAWYKGNSSDITHPVGTKQENELGVYDMSGNVWEWVWTDSSASNDFDRIIRGGSWDEEEFFCSVFMWNVKDLNGDASIGFRLAINDPFGL